MFRYYINFYMISGVPKSGEGFIHFIGQVHKTKEQFGQDGPISVHCSAGVGRTGVFITLAIVLERMQYEVVLGVFQTVRIVRSQRPAMVQTELWIKFQINLIVCLSLKSFLMLLYAFHIHRIDINSAIGQLSNI